MPTIERRVSANNQNGEEDDSGNVGYSSSDLELLSDKDDTYQYVIVVLTGIDIPQGATITTAYVQFTADESDSMSASGVVRGHDADNAALVSTSDYDISNRTRTSAVVAWNNIPAWSTGASGSAQRTPDLSAIVQEIVDRPGWSSGNRLAIIFEPWTGGGDVSRVADSYSGSAANAPLLHIEYATTLAVSPGAATGGLGAVTPSVVHGSISLTPGTASWEIGALAPAVVLGSVAMATDSASWGLGGLAPSVVLGSVGVTPPAAGLGLGAVDPAIFLGSTTAVPGAAPLGLGAAEPSVVLASQTLAPGLAGTGWGVVDPEVIGSELLIVPGAAMWGLGVVDPAVFIIGSATVSPGAVSWGLGVVGPSVLYGSVVVTPAASTWGLGVVDPSVIYGSVAVTRATAGLGLSVVDPSVLYGSTTALPGVAGIGWGVINPTVIGVNILAPGAAGMGLGVVDPTVINPKLMGVLLTVLARAVVLTTVERNAKKRARYRDVNLMGRTR